MNKTIEINKVKINFTPVNGTMEIELISGDVALEKYTIKNAKLKYESDYLNWHNVLGDENYLKRAVQKKNKLYSEITFQTAQELRNLIKLTDNVNVRVKKGNIAIISEKGHLCDYININELLKDYKRLGLKLTKEESKLLKEYSKYKVEDLIGRKTEIQVVTDIIEFILLGFPLEYSIKFLLEENN